MSSKTARTSIVNEKRFILATRDTGYRSTGAAIAELVDNAVQAEASIVRILISQTGVGAERKISIAVLDNGCGMDASTLATAMQFAGSSRFNDRNGLGRFGMGLPNSSVSQARRVDVYTWRHRDRVLHTYLDIDQIADGSMHAVPPPRRAELPGWVSKHVRKRTGTLVEWTRCDRLDNRKGQTIAEKLRRALGQRFRYFLWRGNKIYVNDELLEPFDPLYLQTNTDCPKAQPFGNALTFEFRTNADPLKTSTVRVRFTELPVAAWHNLSAEVKRELGVVKGAGVSIVRADREIDFGWYFMGTKRKENYDDWWRCEISFNPELDELFGVTHSKQEINPTDVLRNELSLNLEGIAQTLNARVRSAFVAVRQQEQRPATTTEAIAEKREPFLPPFKLRHADSEKVRRPAKSGGVSPEYRYRIKTEPINLPDLYLWAVKPDGTVAVTLNENHAFYEQVYAKNDRGQKPTDRHGLECMILALVRAEMSAVANPKAKIHVKSFARDFSNVLAAYLGD